MDSSSNKENILAPRHVTRSASRIFKNDSDKSKDIERFNITNTDDKENFTTPRKVTRSATRIVRKDGSNSLNEVTQLESKLVALTVREDSSHNLSKSRRKSQSADQIKVVNSNLHSGNYREVLCRNKEMDIVTDFLVTNFTENQSRSLYISGKPGTGKTIVVMEVLKNLKKSNRNNFNYYYLNCMNFSQAKSVFSELVKLLSLTVVGVKDKAIAIEEFLQQKGKRNPIVLIVDEIDQLLSKNQTILYRLFSWTELSVNSLTIIGIANSLDLTERLLPNLIVKAYKPLHIHFPPYTEKELFKIIVSRIDQTLTDNELKAIELCCKKSAAKSGDARAALDVYRFAKHLLETDEVKSLRTESLDRTSGGGLEIRESIQRVPSTPRLLSRVIDHNVMASPSIKHMSRAIKLSEAVADPFSNIKNSETGHSTLPLHNQLVLCAALLLSKRTNQKKPLTIGQIYDKYVIICRSEKISQADMSEVVNFCDLLDTRGLARVKQHQESRMKQFLLMVDEKGVENALADKALLTRIFSNSSDE